MAEKKRSMAGINPSYFIKQKQLKKKRKEASEKPRRNLKKVMSTKGISKVFKDGGRS